VNYKKLSKRIEIELNEIEKLINRIDIGLKKAKQSSDDYYIDSVALNLHGLYSSIEKIFIIIAENIDNELPDGKDWHIKLIEQMIKEVKNTRPAIISKELAGKLDEYRGFRHIVRNVYSYNFKAEKIDKLVVNVRPIFHELKIYINAFNEFLKLVEG
jgi:hypothetical protein